MLDTNFLTLPFQFRIDVFAELERLLGGAEYATISACANELRSLAKKERPARLALALLERLRVEASGDDADAELLRIAAQNHAVLCTNDAELRAEAKQLGIRTVIMKGKTHLDFG